MKHQITIEEIKISLERLLEKCPKYSNEYMLEDLDGYCGGNIHDAFAYGTEYSGYEFGVVLRNILCDMEK
jgi:hypothetical protein